MDIWKYICPRIDKIMLKKKNKFGGLPLYLEIVLGEMTS